LLPNERLKFGGIEKPLPVTRLEGRRNEPPARAVLNRANRQPQDGGGLFDPDWLLLVRGACVLVRHAKDLGFSDSNRPANECRGNNPLTKMTKSALKEGLQRRETYESGPATASLVVGDG